MTRLTRGVNPDTMRGMISTTRFSPSKTFLLGSGFLGVSVIWALYNLYVPIFLKETFNLSSTLIGFIMTFDNIFAILLLPFLGALSDRTRTRLGRRRPYILVGSILGAAFFIFIPSTMGTEILSLAMATIILMNLSMALFRSPVIALMPDITPSPHRSQANGIINFMGGVGSLLVYFGGKPLYDTAAGLPFLAGGLLMLAACIVVVIFVREPPAPEPAAAEGAISLRGSSRELAANLRDVVAGEKSLLLILVSIFLWFVGYNAIETFFSSYAKYYLGIGESSGGLVFGAFSLAFMGTALVYGILGTKLARRSAIRIGLVILLVILAASLFLKSFWPLAAAFVVGGFGWALVNINSLPMVVDMTTAEKVGGYTGLYYLFSQAANIIAPPAAGFFIDQAGYESLMIFSCIFFAAAIVTMSFVKRGEAVPAG